MGEGYGFEREGSLSVEVGGFVKKAVSEGLK